MFACIDLGKWKCSKSTDIEKQIIAEAWNQGFSTTGLVYVKNHGLGTLYSKVVEEWKLFCSMPHNEKMKFSSPLYGRCGYNCVGKEAVALSHGHKS